jgi:gliding motility-associated-like protein
MESYRTFAILNKKTIFGTHIDIQIIKHKNQFKHSFMKKHLLKGNFFTKRDIGHAEESFSTVNHFSINLRLILLLCSVLVTNMAWSQVSISSNIKANTGIPLHVCDTGHTFILNFGVSSTISGGNLNISMPSGIEYESGTLTVVSGSVSFAAPTGAPNNPTFSFGSITGPTSISLRYRVKASCSAIAAILASTPIQNVVTITPTAGAPASNTSATYNINYGTFNWVSVSNSPFSGNVGGTFSRLAKITNSGNGVITKFHLDAVFQNGLKLDSVTLAPGISVPITKVGDSSVVYVNMSSFTPAQRTSIASYSNSNGGNMNNDTFLFTSGGNAEVLVFNYHHRILKCDSNLATYVGHYGCNAANNCVNGTEARQSANILINSGGPRIIATGVLQNADTTISKLATQCQTGRGSGYWRNAGTGGAAGFAKDFTPLISYNFISNSLSILNLGSNVIDTANNYFYDAVTYSGTSIPLTMVKTGYLGGSRFSGWWEVSPNTLTSDPDGPGGLSDLDGDGFYDDLAVGDTFKMRWLVSTSKEDTSSCPFARGTLYGGLTMKFNNQCGVNQSFLAGDASINMNYYGNSYNSNNMTFAGPADISDGQTITLTINAPDAYSEINVFNVGQTYYTEYRVVLPAGMTISGTPTIKGNSEYGSAATLPVASVTTVGGVTIIRSQNNTNGIGSLTMNISLACLPGCVNPKVVSLPFTIVHTEEGASGCIKKAKLGCSNYELKLHCTGCPCNFGFQTLNGSADRVTFGFTSTAMTARVNALTPGVSSNKLMSGDTLLVSSKGVVTGGTFNNGWFRVYYNDIFASVPLQFAGGTAKIYDASSGLSATMNVPAPTVKNGVGFDTLIFNFTSAIGVSPTSLANFSTGDSLNVDILLVLVDPLITASAPTQISTLRMQHYARETVTDTIASCDDFGDNLEYWSASMNSFYNGNNPEIQGCGSLTRHYYTYMERYWVLNNYWANEFRPLAKVDTLEIEFGRNPIFLTPTPRITYLGDTSTGWSNSGTRYIFWRTGGWDPVFDDHPIGGTIKGGQGIDIPLKNTCEWQGTFNTQMIPKGVLYRGNTPVPLTNTVSTILHTPNNSRTITKSTLSISPIASSFLGINSPAVWDVRVCNQTSLAAGKPWVAFELPSGITTLSIEDMTSGSAVPMTVKPYGSGKVYAQFNTTLAGSACYTARLKATYATCVRDSIKAITGFNCDTLETNPDLNTCTKWSTFLYLDPALTSFQINKIYEPSAPQQLCADTFVNLEIVNTNNATANNLKLRITMPAGSLVIPGSGTASYILQSGGSYLAIPNPTILTGNVYEFDLSSAPNFSSTLGTNGLVGALLTPNNKFNIRFGIRTDNSCNYVSGSQLKYTMTGNNPCGSTALPFTSTSNLVLINGAPTNPNTYGVTMTLNPTGFQPCDTTPNIFKIKAASFGPTAVGTNEKIRVTLPANVTFNTGSYTSIKNNIGAPTVTTISGQQQLDWNLTSGVAVGDSFVFTIAVNPSTLISCGTVDVDARTLVSFSTTCISNGATCSLVSTTGSQTITTNVIKPSFDITLFTASSVPNGAVGETVSASVTVNNTGGNRTASYYVKFYNDANLNGVQDGSDFILDSVLVASPHNSNTVKMVSKTFNVAAGRACPLIAVIDSGACVCAKAQKLQASVPLVNAISDTVMCFDKTAILGLSPIAGYTYIWNPGTDLSNSNIGNPIYTSNNATNSPIVTSYILTTLRGSGCTSNDTVVVTANPGPQGLDITASNTCIKSAITLTASSTSAGVTYTWKIDGITSGTGTSITPTMTAGVHSVEITAALANGCSAVFTKSFTFYDVNVSATATQTNICQGSSTTLTANSSNAVSYSWYKFGSSTILGLTPSLSSGNLNDSATFKVVVTNGTCKDSSSVFIGVVKSILSARVDTTICPGQTVTLSVPVSFNTANWVNLTDGTGTSGLTYNVTPLATTSYRVIATTASPVCTASDTVMVTVRAVTLPVIAGVRTVCSGGSTTYTAAPTGTSPSWTASSGGITSGGVYTAPTVTSSTNVVITYSHTDVNGCVVMDTHTIVINPLPILTITSSNASMCASQTRTLTATPAGGTFSGTGVSAGVFTAPTTPNSYSITYTFTDGNGCVGTTSQSITVNPRVGVTTVTFNPTVVCVGSTTSASSSPSSGSWSVLSGPGTINAGTGVLSTTGTSLITVRYTHPGISGSSCPDTIQGTITPVARPTVAPSASPSTICNGASTTIAANAASGTTPYTYAWNIGTGASHSQSPTSNTAYNVTVTDNNSCTASGTVNVTVTGSTPLAADAGSARAICTGASTNLGGSPTGTGGAGGYTYSWTSSPAGFTSTAANPSASPTVTTTYTVTVTSSTCTVSSSVVVTVNPRPTVAPTASPSSICNGQSSTISAGAAGGTAPLSYTWNIGSGASHSQSPTATTAYNVTVTDANSCSAAGTVTVNVTGSTPLAADAGSARAICNGASTTLGGAPTATGGAGGYTYSWSGGASAVANPTVSPTATTTYTVTVTSSGCTVSSSVVVTVNPRPTVAPTATPSSICNGQSSTIAANGSGGTGTLTYTWSPFGTGASHSQSPSTTTSYNVTVSDVNACTASGSVTLNVIGISPLSANAGTSRTICSGVSTNLGGSPTATGGSGGYTYSWSSSPAGFTSAAANPAASPTATTTYTVTVTSSTCTATNTVVVTVNPSPSVAPSASLTTICNGQSTTISANATGGTPTLTYAWNNGSGASHTASPTSNTTYIVTVTDANSCTATGSVSVTVTGSTPLAADAGSARAICNGASTNLGGSPTGTGGAGGYTYSWASNPAGFSSTAATPTASPTATTTYTVTVTSSGCTATSSVVVTVNPRPSVNVTASPAALCNGQSTTISSGATGGTGTLAHTWSGGSGTSFTATPSSTTSYSVTVTDANGCTASGAVTVVVTGTSPLVAVAGSARAICNGASTTLGGSPTGSGGAGSPTFLWSGGLGTGANPVASPSSTTLYRVTVTSSGCTAVDSVLVTVNPRPNVAPSAGLTTLCYGASTMVKANASGGTGTKTFNWSPSGSGDSFLATPNATTIYNVTATDANGCTASGNVSVNVTGSSPLTVNAGTNRTICDGSSTSLGATPTGNGGNTSGTYIYSWSSNPAGFTSTAANPTVSPTATTTYTVTVTNTGCIATSSVVVSVNPRPAAVPSASVNPVCSGSNTTITANPTGGTAPYTYQWNTSQTSASFVASPTTTVAVTNAYTVTVTDVNGCSISATINVNVTPLPVMTPIANQSVCIPASGGTVALAAAAMTVGQTGAWSTITSPSGAVSFSAGTSANTNVSTLSPINTYTFRWTLTETGCSNWTNTNVTVNESPVIEAGMPDTICRDASKTLSASLTSVSPATINWKVNTLTATPFAFSASTTVSPMVTTKYIFTAAITPCIVSDTVQIAVIQAPNLNDDVAVCLAATEDNAAAYHIPPTIGTNDILTGVLKGGVTYKVVSSKNSTVMVSNDSIKYTPNLNFNGRDTVMIEAYSNTCTLLRDTSMFCVDVAAVNDKPNLTNDLVKAIGTNPKTFNPLSNDSDIETTLKGGNITIVSGPNQGTLTGPAANGEMVYTGNNANLAILDTIVYEVCDSGIPMPTECNIARIIVQLVPQINDVTTTTNPGTPVTIGTPVTTGPGVILTPSLSGPSKGSGTASVNPTTGVVTFTPNDTPFIGKDTIRKVLCFTYPDGSEACDTSFIYISNPNVNNQEIGSTPMNTPFTYPALKPYKFEGGVATTTSSPGLSINPTTGVVTFTPKPGFVGIDTSKITRCDSKGNCVTDLYITVVTPNLKDTTVRVPQGLPVTLKMPITRYPGQSITSTVMNPVDNGTATIGPDGSVTYKSNSNFTGKDTLLRRICVYDSSNMQTFCDTIMEIFDVFPHATNPDIAVGNMNETINGNVATNDIVLPGTTYGTPVASSSNPSSTVPTMNPNGTYTFNASVPGTYVFTVPVCPVGYTTGCPTETLTITVVDPSRKDNKPIVNADRAITKPSTPVKVDVLANDATGNIGIPLNRSSLAIATAPKNGTVAVNSDGTITYTPNAGFLGRDTFYYTICDQATPPNCGTGMAVVNVTNEDLADVRDDVAKGNGVLTGNVLSNDKFPAGSVPSVKPVDTLLAGKGRLVIDANGNYTWTPVNGFNGSIQVPVTVCDGKTPQTCYTSTLHIVSTISADVVIPNYFSPNGDGINDVWSLDDLLDRYPNARAMIYNRWGNVVWRSTGPYGRSTSGKNVWHGQLEGAQDLVPDGVYYYLIEIEDEFKTTKTGFIEIMRQ